ncbi:hypothetical protein EDC04DRAFT_172927 [Pisolithus marmoratus]|nr:hypothetical protein EDC04DRAFT_172927 [Pisolithus marmoratus]
MRGRTAGVCLAMCAGTARDSRGLATRSKHGRVGLLPGQVTHLPLGYKTIHCISMREGRPRNQLRGPRASTRDTTGTRVARSTLATKGRALRSLEGQRLDLGVLLDNLQLKTLPVPICGLNEVCPEGHYICRGTQKCSRYEQGVFEYAINTTALYTSSKYSGSSRGCPEYNGQYERRHRSLSNILSITLKTTEGIATRKKQAHETEESGYIVQRQENDFERKKKHDGRWQRRQRQRYHGCG